MNTAANIKHRSIKDRRIWRALVEEFGLGTCLADVEMSDLKWAIYDTIRDDFDTDDVGSDAAWDKAGEIADEWDGRVL